MIPDGERVRVRNVHADPTLAHVDGYEGEIVCSYYLAPERRYLVCVNGLDYDLTSEGLVYGQEV